LKKLSREGELSGDVLEAIMKEEKANQREMFKVPMERLRKFVPKGDAKQAEDFVMKACEYYHKYLIRQRNRDER
jgi:ParB family chromosome partitioning protein